MGYGGWSKSAYNDISNTRSTKSIDDNFVQNKKGVTHNDLSPIGVDIRESRDSAEHPNSVPVIVAVDVTGSMGRIPENLIKKKLGALMNTIIDNGIPDPQIMFMAIGDHISDKHPLQVGQFESETAKIDGCLEKIYIEGNGGGQRKESYALAWYFAARHTSIDSFEKRGEKGFIFTIGDEGFHENMTEAYLESKVGYTGKEDLSANALFDEVSQSYHVFHIHANEGQYRNHTPIFDQWKKLIGERFLVMDDQNNIAELIATTVAVVHGVDIDAAMAGFDSKTKHSVSTALATVKDSLVRRDSSQAGIIAL